MQLAHGNVKQRIPFHFFKKELSPVIIKQEATLKKYIIKNFYSDNHAYSNYQEIALLLSL